MTVELRFLFKSQLFVKVYYWAEFKLFTNTGNMQSENNLKMQYI